MYLHTTCTAQYVQTFCNPHRWRTQCPEPGIDFGSLLLLGPCAFAPPFTLERHSGAGSLVLLGLRTALHHDWIGKWKGDVIAQNGLDPKKRLFRTNVAKICQS